MNSFLNKRIPTIAGLLLLAIAVFATSYLVNTGVIFFGGAAPSENPQDVRITNVTDTSFTVTYKTEAKVIGTIALNQNGTTQAVLDERDQQSGTPQAYHVHSISVKNAKADTTYDFSITSGATTYQNNGAPFSAKTGPILTASPSATTPVSGELRNPDGSPAIDALVFATTKGGQFVSTLTNSHGTYIIPLNALRTNDFSALLPLTNEALLQILATNGLASSQAQVTIETANPIPLMTLGNNYNFVTQGTTPIASTAASLGFPSFPASSFLATPVIITPKKDETFTDAQPRFTGTALPNQTVTIEIHSSDIVSATVTSDNNGNWVYRPTTPLSPGQHIVSITTKNAAGILQTVQQSFTVFASGSQVTQTATPSGQLTPTATPTVISPTAVPTILPSITPMPTIVSVISPSPKPTLPPTGSNVVVISSVLGLVTTIAGVVLFALTRGATL